MGLKERLRGRAGPQVPGLTLTAKDGGVCQSRPALLKEGVRGIWTLESLDSLGLRRGRLDSLFRGLQRPGLPKEGVCGGLDFPVFGFPKEGVCGEPDSQVFGLPQTPQRESVEARTPQFGEKIFLLA